MHGRLRAGGGVEHAGGAHQALHGAIGHHVSYHAQGFEAQNRVGQQPVERLEPPHPSDPAGHQNLAEQAVACCRPQLAGAVGEA
ncbi:hypothetical protein N7U49_48510 (plasmid) [Streptomyces sp. AD2-2]|nr:hypothetical protein N7U49_48510 [Streptomyces sp. AD2-2]